MKQIKKVYVLTLVEKHKGITYISVLGTFSNEKSAKQVMEKTFDGIYESEYSKMDKNNYVITKNADKMTIAEILNSDYVMLEITETILDKWEK